MTHFAFDDVRTFAVAGFAALCSLTLFVASVSANASGLIA